MKIYGTNEYKNQSISIKNKVYKIADSLGLIAEVSNVSKNCINVKLNIDTSKTPRPYQRFGYDKKTRINAVCWHGFKDFLVKLYNRFFMDALTDHLRIVTAQIEYKNKLDFYDKYESTMPNNTNCICNSKITI